MRIEAKVIYREDMYSMLSKNYYDYCVFIQPSGIVDFENDIKKFNLNCTIYDLSSEETMIELYNSEKDALKRIEEFINDGSYYYVSLYKEGKLLDDNQK